MVPPGEGNEARGDGRRGVGVSQSTAEAGELSPRDPVEGRGHRQVAPLEGKTANTPRLGPVSTSRQRIAELARQALGMAVAIAWLPGPAGTRRRVAKLSVEEPDAAEPARPDLWGARVSNDPGLPDLSGSSSTTRMGTASGAWPGGPGRAGAGLSLAASATGIVKVKRAPRPTPPLSARMRPPWASTRPLQMARPSPLPRPPARSPAVVYLRNSWPSWSGAMSRPSSATETATSSPSRSAAIRLRQICAAREVTIIRGAVSPDHVHMLVVAPPQLSPSKLVQFLKRRSSRMLQREFPALRKRYWGQHLWARGLLLRECRRGGRKNDPGIYRAPAVGRGRRRFQSDRADRALSRRGTNENTNGLLRQYFPKGTNLSTYTQADLNTIAQRLNSRPRKTLGYATPADTLRPLLH